MHAGEIIQLTVSSLRYRFRSHPGIKAHLHTATAIRHDSRIAATSLLNRSQSGPPATSNLVAVTVAVADAVCNSTVHKLCN